MKEEKKQRKGQLRKGNEHKKWETDVKEKMDKRRGTSVFGGVGTIFGTFIGCFIIGAIEAAIVAIGLV